MDIAQSFDRLLAEQRLTIEAHLRVILENMQRVGRLIGAFDGGGDDVLRSAVVFLHATQEDVLRSIAAVLLPYASEAVLNRVPMIGTPGARPDKFFLGRLSTHREKTVAEVIAASVQEYLRHTTFNNVTEIAELLRSLNFFVEPMEVLFPQLEALMRRRHQIVHRADRGENGEVVPITREQVVDWSEAVIKFISTVEAQMHNLKVFIGVEGLLREIAQLRNIELKPRQRGG